MKKSILLTLLMILGVQLVFSQVQKSQRLVLIEHFTQASCGFCPPWNTAYNNLVSANPGKVVILRYQVSWPGYDPMNLHNPGEVANRVALYGINAVPASRLDGTNVGQVTQSSLDNRYAISSPCTINLSHHLSPNYDSILVSMTITATEDMPASLKAHIAVIEEHIHFASPPGSNGESDFYNVMKKMLPNANGTTLPALTTGQSYTINLGWKLKNVYDIDELAVIAFVQNSGTKEVLQSGRTVAVPVVPLYSYDANLMKLISEHDCSGNARPSVTFANFGSTPLTDLTFKYNVNGGTEKTYTWHTTTALNFLEQTTVVLDTINFSDENNLLTVRVCDPNGQPDQNNLNDTAKISFVKYKDMYSYLTLKMKLDGYASHITWKILKPDGNILKQGGPYNNNQPITVPISAPTEGCYKFFIMDSEGDGLLAPGYYKIYDSFNHILVDSTSFTGFQKVHPFNVRFDAGINEQTTTYDVSIFPNPFRNETRISFILKQAAIVELSVLNILGNIVYSDYLGNLNKGEQYYVLPAKNLKSGVYFIKMKIGNKLITKKIVVN